MTHELRWPDVILVNGPSSAGKSTLCRALQKRLSHPYLCVGFDDFIGFSAPRYYRGAGRVGLTPANDEVLLPGDHGALGVTMRDTATPGGPPNVTAWFGPVFRRLLDSMAPSIRALVDGGNSVIFDHVLHDAADYDSCQHAFAGLDVFKVGVFCPLDILEARERARGDRIIGRARGLVSVVHSFCGYDVEVDTGTHGAVSCADTVIAALETNRRL